MWRTKRRIGSLVAAAAMLSGGGGVMMHSSDGSGGITEQVRSTVTELIGNLGR